MRSQLSELLWAGMVVAAAIALAISVAMLVSELTTNRLVTVIEALNPTPCTNGDAP